MIQPIHAEFSIAAAMEDQQNQKRKREFHRQSSQTEEEPVEPSHKRSTSRSGTNYNANIFRVAANTVHDEESREDPVDEEHDDELNSLVNSYRRQRDVGFQCVQGASSRPLDEDEHLSLVNAYRRQHEEETLGVVSPLEPLDLPLSPKEQESCDYMTFSPVSSFFHPAILRATTICESASDILCGQDPPEVDSRPTSPHVYQEEHEDEHDATAATRRTSLGDTVIAEEKEREAPSWLNASSTFNWSIPKSNAGSSPWTGVFQLGSS